MAEKEKSRKQNPIQAYFRETAGELRKVSWPSRREVIQLTTIVLVVMVIMGAILGVTDVSAHSLLNLILGLS